MATVTNGLKGKRGRGEAVAPAYAAAVPRRRLYLLRMTLLVAALLCVYLAGNGRVPLFDRDEPRYAVTSRAMLESGDWVVPRFLGEVRTAKPPAIYWLQAAAMRGFGTGEFAVRLPGALACAAAVALLAFELPALVGRRRATWAAFMMGTSVLVLGVAKVGVIDGVLLLCVTAVQIALLRIIRHRGPDLANAAVLWMAVGLGGMLKGPVILGVLGMTLLAWWASRWIICGWRAWEGLRPRGPSEEAARGVESRPHSRSLPREEPVSPRSVQSSEGPRGRGPSQPGVPNLIRRLHPLLGLLIVAIICGPWLMMISIREPSFIPTALGHDVATRSVSGLEGHGQPPGFHLLALFGTWFPWSVLLPATLLHAWRRRGDETIRFALAACVGPWIMFEIVVTKLPHYLLVIFPMLALLTADWLVTALKAWERHRQLPPGMRAAGIIYGLVAAGFGVAPLLLGVVSWPAMLVAAAWAGAMVASWWRGRLGPAIVAAGVGMAIFVGVGYVDWLARASMLNVSRRAAQALHESGATEAAMVHYKEPSLGWYAGESGVRVQEAEESVLESGTGFAVSTRRRLARMPADVQARWEVVATIKARLYNNSLESADVLILKGRRGESATD